MDEPYRKIYAEQALEYDRMISAVDCDGHLLPTLQTLTDLDGCDVVEVGVGTGRVTQLLTQAGVRSVLGIDSEPAMLDVARQRLGDDNRVTLRVGDARAVPCEDGHADVFAAGWVYGHQTSWDPLHWPEHVLEFLAEANRVTRPGGMQLIIETLGTGSLEPRPPNRALSSYYGLLEDHGFRRVSVATDYLFASAAAAAEAMGFFFGPDITRRIVDHDWARVPEWTGIWWRQRIA